MSNALNRMPKFSGDPQEVKDWLEQWKGINPFKEAKQLLWDGKEFDGGYEFICHAIEQAADMGKISPAQKFIAQKMVSDRLPVGDTVVCYLRRLNIKPELITNENVQFFRHRWVEHLAKEWEEGVRQ